MFWCLFPEGLSNILSLLESGVRRSLNLTGKNLQSAQNNDTVIRVKLLCMKQLVLLPPCREANLDRSPNIVLKKKKRLSLFTTTSLTENRSKINNYLQHQTAERSNREKHKLTAFSRNE